MAEPGDPRTWARAVNERPLWVRVVVGIAVALAFGTGFALRDSVSHGDLAFKIAMAITGVVAIGMVAPGLFTGSNRDPTEWGDKIKELENSSNNSTGEKSGGLPPSG